MIETIQKWMNANPVITEALKFVGIIILAIAAYWITKKVLLKLIEQFIKRTKTKLDDFLFNKQLLRRLSLIIPLVILRNFAYLVPEFENLIARLLSALIAFVVLISIGSFLTSTSEALEQTDKFKEKPIKGYVQIVKIILYILGGILLIGIFTGQSVWNLLGGIGALTAVILLVFRDTILSFVASIQISSYDLVKKGDWIEVPKYGADGDVIDIALHTVKVQNWDKTITTIPTYKLIEESFKNWRGMQKFGGRRIMRSVYIDQSSIKFLDEKMIEKFEKFRLISDYIKQKKKEIAEYNAKFSESENEEMINFRRLTNIGTFRAYLKAYLASRDDLHSDIILMVRQLEPTPQGLPVQVYIFAKSTQWVEYEHIQSEVFDHILSVVPEFDLKIFQNPSGNDVRDFLKQKESE
jgi:miniconductance mechanosensitive channel